MNYRETETCCKNFERPSISYYKKKKKKKTPKIGGEK